MGRDWWGPFDHIEAPVIPSFDNPLACACRGDGVGGLAWPTGKGWPILNDGIDLLVEFGQGKCLGLRRHDDEHAKERRRSFVSKEARDLASYSTW